MCGSNTEKIKVMKKELILKATLLHLQDLIPTLAGVITYIFYTGQSRD